MTVRRSVLLVRHGRTAGNAGGLIMGRRDLPLDEVGEAQVRALADALRTLSVDEVHTSPLLRARQTAAAIATACQAPVHTHPELLELDFGTAATVVSGSTPGGGPAPRPKLEVKTRHLYDPLPGGESLHDVWRRLERLVPRLAPAVEHGRLLVIVGHYRTNQLLEGMLLGRSFEAAVRDSTYKPENASAHEVNLALGITTALWPPR